jgi:hypothetical protein
MPTVFWLVEFHSSGGPFSFTAEDHAEFVDAFYRIAQDRNSDGSGRRVLFPKSISYRKAKPRLSLSLGKENPHEQHQERFTRRGT